MKTLLVTGGCGFIGSNFIHHMLKQPGDYTIVNLDVLTYAGNADNLEAVTNNDHYYFVEGSITDAMLVESLFSQYEFDGVIHFAAESHVDRSITGPEIFVQTNVLGT